MFGFLPHNLYTGYNSANTAGLSPRLWSRLSGSMMSSDGSKRLVLVGDDFLTVKDYDTYVDLHSECVYTSYIDTGGTLTGLADEKSGVLAMTNNGDANEEIWLQLGDNIQPLGFLSDTSGDDHLTVFEARFKLSSITDGDMPSFVGLMSPGAGGNNTMVDTSGAIKNVACIGFNVLLDGNSVDFVYKAAGQTIVRAITGAKVPVADTFFKAGFIYDPGAVPAKRIAVYVDNVESSTYVTSTNIATATFPDAEALTFMAGFKNVNAVATELAMDWWAFGQLI